VAVDGGDDSPPAVFLLVGKMSGKSTRFEVRVKKFYWGNFKARLKI